MTILCRILVTPDRRAIRVRLWVDTESAACAALNHPSPAGTVGSKKAGIDAREPGITLPGLTKYKRRVEKV
jgi:hypothetical protein